MFTIITAPIWVFCQDNPTFRKNNPWRKKVWQEEEEARREEERRFAQSQTTEPRSAVVEVIFKPPINLSRDNIPVRKRALEDNPLTDTIPTQNPEVLNQGAQENAGDLSQPNGETSETPTVSQTFDPRAQFMKALSRNRRRSVYNRYSSFDNGFDFSTIQFKNGCYSGRTSRLMEYDLDEFFDANSRYFSEDERKDAKNNFRLNFNFRNDYQNIELMDTLRAQLRYRINLKQITTTREADNAPEPMAAAEPSPTQDWYHWPPNDDDYEDKDKVYKLRCEHERRRLLKIEREKYKLVMLKKMAQNTWRKGREFTPKEYQKARDLYDSLSDDYKEAFDLEWNLSSLRQ
jgi:hypothetical protein